MTIQETEKVVKEVKEEKKENTNKKDSFAPKLQKALEGFVGIFSIQNLIMGLLSALLVIGASLGAYYVSQYFQEQFQKNPELLQIISTSISLSLFIIMMLAAIIPGLAYCVQTKNWKSLPYILIIEVAFIALFFTLIFFFAPKEDSKYMQDYQNYIQSTQ